MSDPPVTSSYIPSTIAPSDYPSPYQVSEVGATTSPYGSVTAPPPAFLRTASFPSSASDASSSAAPLDPYHPKSVYELPPASQAHALKQYSPSGSGTYELPPASPAPGSAALLLQQHQANQTAFRSGLGTQPLQTTPFSATSVASKASGDGLGSRSPSREGSVGSSASAGAQQGGHAGQSALQQGDGDFTQTFYDPFRIKHRRRTSPQQLKVLEYHFDINPKPDVTTRKNLSEQLDMTPREVQVWFQNRRAKVKKLREKAEREAANAQESARVIAAHDAALAAVGSSLLSNPELPIPPPLPQLQQQQRALYGQDAFSNLRRGSTPAVFGSSSGLPTPSAFDNPFQPLPIASPSGPLPPQNSTYGAPPPPPLGASVAYPSPASLAFSTSPSPRDFQQQQQQQQPPLPVPSYLQNDLGPGGGSDRRFSLPVYNSLYASDPQPLPLPAPTQQHHELPSQHFPLPQLSSYATSAPAEHSYLDQRPLPPLHAENIAMGGPYEGHPHSPSSSLGDAALSWDGHAAPAFQMDGFSDQYRAPCAPPAQLRRASCPAPQPDGGADPAFDQFGNPLPQPGPPPQQQQQQQHAGWFSSDFAATAKGQTAHSSTFAAGYSMSSTSIAAPAATSSSPHQSPLPGYAQPLPGGFSRRGSLAAPPSSLGTITEQPTLPVSVPGAFDVAAYPQHVGSPSPPSSVQGQRRGSVARTVRSTHGSLHSPYAAAAHDRHDAGP
ncbi:hypothetical protein JCM10213_007435 [Rhodosporidiobolus nylandii]